MIRHQGTKVLRTERLTLRPFRAEDAPAVYRWMSDPEVCRYECWLRHKSLADSRRYIEALDGYRSPLTYHWGIERDRRLIGSIGIVRVNDFHQKAQMGYCLVREEWGKGYAAEAARVVTAYMLEEVGLNRIEASHAVRNTASGRVLQKAGFRWEGRAEDYYYCHEGLLDSDLYAITKRQYFADNAGMS